MVAYFSMEIALASEMPTYAGGLGVLAGDLLRAAADLSLPFVGVTLLHRQGYFRQRLDAAGRQREEAAGWDIDAFLQPVPTRVEITINRRRVFVGARRGLIAGCGGGAVPVYFLDTDLDGNAVEDRMLTHVLYGGDPAYRLAQEAVLGIGGVRMLRALGHHAISKFHLNEGHSALLAVELLEERLRVTGAARVTDADVEAVRQSCVFTTHTPVPAAHDQFPPDLVHRVLDEATVAPLVQRCCYGGALNMTYVALTFSGHVNGVAMRHGSVARQMFGGYDVDAITNGVHAATWVSAPMAAVFDRHIPGWRRDNFSLRYAVSIAGTDVWDAHVNAKLRLLERVNRTEPVPLDPSVLTLGFARRATSYKRADLLVRDPARLRALAARAGRLQVVFAGKAHPRDEDGKTMIQRVFRAREDLRGDVAIAYLEDYDMAQAAAITAGVDVWLNTPQPPLEASGTSGMKAALNGVPSLSVLDGWWLEGHVEGITGWAIGSEHDGEPRPPPDDIADATALYDLLEHTVLPLFYQQRERFTQVMRYAIALNGSFFTAQRMLQEYVLRVYAPADPAPRAGDGPTATPDTR